MTDPRTQMYEFQQLCLEKAALAKQDGWVLLEDAYLQQAADIEEDRWLTHA